MSTRRSRGCVLEPFDPALDRGADEPRRRTRPRGDPARRSRRSASPPVSMRPNRVIFKQLMQAQPSTICQIDACRLGGVNEVLAVLPARGEVRRSGLRARGRPRAVRVRAAPVRDRLRVCERFARRSHDRVRRPPSRALRPSGGNPRRRYVLPSDAGYSVDLLPAPARCARVSRMAPCGGGDAPGEWPRPAARPTRTAGYSAWPSDARRSATCSPVCPTMTRAATVDVARAAGIRYFDTAPLYGHGVSERRLGGALRASRDEYVLSTKVGRVLRPAGPATVPKLCSPTSATSSPSSTSPVTGSCGRSTTAWCASARIASTSRSCTTPTTMKTTRTASCPDADARSAARRR